jgi:TPR repeat protein
VRCLAAALLLMAASAGAAPAPAPELRTLRTKAETGDTNAQFALGEAYRAGRGVTADPATAIMWYRRAANQGHVRASEELGFALFAKGDRREAMPYIEKAAARGDARALYVLGTAHFNGDYATRDWPLAYAQTLRAASAGLPAATKNLDLMDRYLLPTDKAKAEEILATLPPVRSIAQREALNNASPAGGGPVRKAVSPVPVKVSKAGIKPSETAASPTPPGPPAARGAWRVQLGAFGSADRARESWTKLAAKVPRLASYEQRVVGFQSVQRLQATGIAGKSDAEALCRQIRSAGGQCFAVAP